MSDLKRCLACGEVKPNTRDFFGGTGTGTGKLRGKCRACMNAYSRDYNERNKDKRQIRDEKRAASGRRASFASELKRELFKKQNGLCICCFELIPDPGSAQVDHMKPLSRGGKDDRSNYLLVHAKCNQEKHGKTLQEYWRWRVVNGLDQENLGVKFGFIPNP